MQPIDYRLNVRSPFEAAMTGVKFGASLAELEQARQDRALKLQQQQLEQQQAEEQARLMMEARKSFFNNPNPTLRDAVQFVSLLPKQQQEGMKPFVEQIAKQETKSAEQSSLNFAMQTLTALETNPAEGIKLLRTRAEAEKNSGNDANAMFYENMANMAEQSPAAAFKVGAALVANAPGGKEAIEATSKARDEQRQAELQPLEVAAKKRQNIPTSIQEAIDFNNLTPEQKKTFQDLQLLKKPPAAVTNVSVTNLEKSASGELAKLLPDLYSQANAAASQLGEIPRYRQALNKAITGPFAEQRLTVARIGSAFGFQGDKSVNATREVIQGMAEMALSARGILAGQGTITDAEQKLLLQAKSGDINFTKGELQVLLNVAERAAKAQYKKSRRLLESASTRSETAGMFLDNVSPIVEEQNQQKNVLPPGTKLPGGFQVLGVER